MSGRVLAYPEPAPCIPEAPSHLLGVAAEPGPPGPEARVGVGGSAWWNLWLFKGSSVLKRDRAPVFRCHLPLGAAPTRASQPSCWLAASPRAQPLADLLRLLRFCFCHTTRFPRVDLLTCVAFKSVLEGTLQLQLRVRADCHPPLLCHLLWLPRALKVKPGRLSACHSHAFSVGGKPPGTKRSGFPSLCLSFLICKMGATRTPTSQRPLRSDWYRESAQQGV